MGKIIADTYLTDNWNFEEHTFAVNLRSGTLVEVLEVQQCHKTNRIRGRTEQGFFSIRGVGPDHHMVWAVHVNFPPSIQDPARRGVILRQSEGDPGVRVYENPVPGSNVLGAIPCETEVQSIGEHGDFVHVSCPFFGLEGWV